MTDYRSMYDSNYIYAFDLKGRDVTVTIKEVRQGKLHSANGKDQRKPILFFVESKDARGFAAGKMSTNVIAELYGKDIEGWVGKRITLFATKVDAFGKLVEAIRVRPTIPRSSARSGEFAEAQEMPAPEAPDHAEVDEKEG